MKIERLFFVLLLFCPGLLKAQKDPLEQYVKEGLSNNIVLQQKNIALDKSLYSLKAAQSLFLPTVGLQGNYQSGSGGRSIAIPTGDLLNGVYSTLNQLTSSGNFPQIENVKQYFFPNDFLDAKLHTTMPIINTDLIYNKKIQQQQVQLQQYEVVIYKRELVKNIKSAYYSYQSSLEAVRIYESAMQLAAEGKRTNQKLLDNGKGLPAYILRSESEVANTEASLTKAQKQAENAAMYFNFLLNRKLDEPVETPATEMNGTAVSTLVVAAMVTQSRPEREEVAELKQAVSINLTALKMNRQFWTPKLNGFIDLGAQAEHWTFKSDAKYYFAGLQLDVPIFTGRRNNFKIKQSQLDLKNTQLNLDLTGQQITLAQQTAVNNLTAAYSTYQSALKQFEAAASYQRLIEKGYKEGVNTFLETIDARNQLTAARLDAALNQYSVLIAIATLERETANYDLQ